MAHDISNLYPSDLWKYFSSLSQTPRPSKKEQQAVELVKNFGTSIGLETNVDNTGNILIRKPATKGMENRKTVVLQAHLDMVPEKNKDKKHDFEHDAIEILIEDGWATANGTTLGADNGIGVAAIMAILASNKISHGPIEALFTVDEETGMTGAFQLSKDFVKGDILLNTDSEEDGELFIGCAGGIDGTITFNFKKEEVEEDYKGYEITIKGLKGGHSGMDIHLGRANAIILLIRMLWRATFKFNTRLVELHGGSARNAIPREAFAKLLIPANRVEDFIKFAAGYSNILKAEYLKDEPELGIHIQPSDKWDCTIPSDIQNKIISSVYTCPNGVIRMSSEIENLVETSNNVAIVETLESELIIKCLLRSSVDTAKEDLCDRLKALFEMAGAKTVFDNEYPGWNPNPNSEILKIMKEIYKKKYKSEPEVKAVHAGFECGVIGKTYPQLDMISFGPEIVAPHSPDEKVNIKSVGKFWDYLLEVLKNIPER